jgi:hypothetical protein
LYAWKFISHARRFNKQMRAPLPRGEFSKGVGVVSHKELKLEDDETSHTRGAGEGGTWYLRRGKWRGGESFVSGRGDCVRVSPS